MSILGFGKKKLPASTNNEQQFDGQRLNQSQYGATINVLMGPNRVSPKLIWAGDWQDHVTTTPGAHIGKSVGGSNTPGTTTHAYTQSYQFLLGYGEGEINSYWTSSGHIGVVRNTQAFTVPMGGGYVEIND